MSVSIVLLWGNHGAVVGHLVALWGCYGAGMGIWWHYGAIMGHLEAGMGNLKGIKGH